MGDNDITLYAIFRKVYTVTYEKSANVQSISKQSDTCTAYNKATTCNVTLPTITPKAGYTADTWYSGTTAVGHGGDSYTVSGNVTLSTKETVNKYTVTFKDGNETVGTKQVTYGEKYGELPEPTKTGYTFDGWYDGNTKITSDSDVTITADQILTANWIYDADPIISRSDYNTFAVGAPSGSQYLVSKTQTTAPTASTSGWSSTTSYDVSTSEKETWYVWVKDANGNVSPNSTTITNYKVTLTAGTGTTLTAKADTSSGTAVTSNSYVLDGTPVYPTGALSAGYHTLVLKKDGTTITNSSSQVISADTTFATTSTAYTLTLKYHVNGGTITTGTDATRWRTTDGIIERSTDSGATWNAITATLTQSRTYYDLYNVGTYAATKTGYKTVASSAYNTKADGTGVNINQQNTAAGQTNAVTVARINGGPLTENKTVNLYINWVPQTYTITLDNQNADTPGTETIYEKYNTGYYTDSAATTQMTTSANGITVPTKDGYTFGGYYTEANGGGTQVIGANGKLTSSASTTNFTAAGTLYAKWTDSTDPVVSDIEGGTALKATSQNLTLKATDNIGVVAYYFGTTEPTAASAITTTTAADLTAIQGDGLTKNVTAEGTYWFAVKDAAGNFAKKSIVIRKYQVRAVLETIAAASNTTYKSSNYETSGNAVTYYVKNGTTLTLSDIYTKPTGGDVFKGYTTSAPSTTAQTPSTTNPTVATNNTTVYYMWFTRLRYSITVSKPTNGTVKAETVTQTGNSVTASTAAETLTAKYGDTVKATATATTGYTFTGWSGGYVSGTTNPVTGAEVTEAKTITGAFADNTAPTCTLTSTSTLKATSQTATLKCNDAAGVASYYWGTSSSPADGDYVTTAADLSSLTSSSGLNKTVNAAGTYYLFAKDANGNVTVSAASKEYNTYTVNNMLQNVSGSTYTTTDYTQASTNTYIAPNGTTLTTASIYAVPDGSNANRYVGISIGAASTTAASVSKTNATLDQDKVISIWFERNTINFRYKTNGGTLRETTQNSSGSETYTWATNDDGLVTRSVNGATASILNSAYRYGASSINLADYNNTKALYISKSGSLAPSGAQWICESGCATANRTFTQAAYNLTAPAGGVTTDEICNAKNDDCTVIIKVNWKTSATVPTAANYCKTGLVYSGSSQTLTNNAAAGYTFSGNTGTDAESYTVTATLSSGYVWSNGTLTDKTFTCSIEQATPTITFSPDSLTLPVGIEKPFTATVKSGSTATVSGTLNIVSGNTAAATIEPSGDITITNANNTAGVVTNETLSGIGVGTSTITASFTPTDTKNFKTVSQTLTATVEKGIIIKAGPGVSSLTAAGWTGTGTGVITKKYNDGATIDLSTITPTLKTGYTGAKYEITSGDGVINGSTYTVGTGVATLTISASGLETPECLIQGGTTKVYNRSATTLTARSMANNYDSDSVNITYSYGYATSGTAALGNFTAAGTANTFSVAKAAFRNVRYYGVKVVVTDKEDSTITSTCTSGTVDAAVTGTTEGNRTTMTLVNSRINFDATTNGGTRVGTSPLYVPYNSKSIYTGRTNSTAGTIPTATKDGYTFDGWFTSTGLKVINADKTIPTTAVSGWINASGNWVKTGTSTSATSTANTLYAHFTANTYTVSYNYNGGTGGANAPTSGTYDEDVQISNPTKTITITGNANGTGATVGAATSQAQTFAGWTSTTLGANAKSGTAASPTAAWDGTATNDTYFKNLIETGTVTMIANWTPVSITLPTVTKSNYACKWNTEPDGSGTSYSSGATFTPDSSTGANITLYAQCEIPIKAWYKNASSDFHNSTYRTNITSVVFENHTNVPSGATSWDVSAVANSGAVMAWVTTDPDDSTKYTLHIGGDGRVIANTDSCRIFDNFTNLKTVNFNNNYDTLSAENMNYMFYNCTALTNINLGNKFDTSNVTNMDHMFSGCNSLTGLDLGDKFDTSSVTTMKYMFNGCNSLESLDLGDKFDTSRVIYIQYIFNGCNSLTVLDLGDKFDTSRVTSMDSMFGACQALTYLDLGDKFDTSSVTTMQSMFSSCYVLTDLDLGDKFDTSIVTNMYGMFQYNYALTTIYAPTSFVVGSGTNTTSMFTFDENLVGGNGTAYATKQTSDGTYAKIDKPGQEGYFTRSVGTPRFSEEAGANNSKNVTITFPSGCGSDLTCKYKKDNGSYVTVTSSSATVNFTESGVLAATVTDGTTTKAASYTVYFGNRSTIYRWSSDSLANKNSTAASSNPYTITNLTEGTDYVRDASLLNKSYYLKHDISGNEILNSYVCFIYDNKEHCMKGGDGDASFAANTQMIQDYQSFYNIPNHSTAGCGFNSSLSWCNSGGGVFDSVNAYSNGYVHVYGSSYQGCFVLRDGSSLCDI